MKSHVTSRSYVTSRVIVAALAACVATPALAGTFKEITIDGAFADWAGVPVLTADAPADATPIDLASVQIANDATNLYLRLAYHTPVNPNTGPSVFLAIDADNNASTGFNVFGLGLVGSEAAYQNDFPFEQRTGFNSGGLSSAATIAPVNFGDPSALVTAQEYSIPRNLTYTKDGVAVFGESFTLLVYTDGGSADVMGPTPYAFAAVPEPTTLAGVAALAALAGRRRRR